MMRNDVTTYLSTDRLASKVLYLHCMPRTLIMSCVKVFLAA